MKSTICSIPTRRAGLAAAVLGTLLFLVPGLASGSSLDDLQSRFQKAGVEVSGLKVTSAEGVVIVTGSVETPQDARRAADLIGQAGFVRVANLIRVDPTPDDATLAASAERRIASTRALDGSRLAVRCDDGVITLRGTVQDEFQRDLVTRMLRRMDGVKEVRANLQRV